ncbi:hypothetical protein TSUD_274110 [Trifolium subterraneum]|uniref:Uncharacterized protein n=1 Tax=Trifolium subterraneum TaxID=3900 RepID=A0A2Z6LZ24_TRISU|nr:hypothetical protein TSUD_274110 [Trifolium subterraneum]
MEVVRVEVIARGILGLVNNLAEGLLKYTLNDSGGGNENVVESIQEAYTTTILAIVEFYMANFGECKSYWKF